MLAILLGMGLPQASTMARNVDVLYDFIYYICLACFVVLVGSIVYFIIKYRRKSHDEITPYIEGHALFEGLVMFGLFIVVMVFFYWGWADYKKMIHSPPNPLEINLTGRQWLWNFEYTNGRKFTNELVVPIGRPVKLIMTSEDVLHSFFIPDFRLKQDIIPGTYRFLSFTATQLGSHQVFCAEYCGTAHSGMLAQVRVVEPEEYEKWQKTWEWEKQLGLAPGTATAAEKPAVPGAPPQTPLVVLTPVERGKRLFSEKGCTGCHTITGATLVGPSLKGAFGHEVELEGGQKITMDENYIRESLTEPNAKLVKGFQPLMPTFKGTLSEDEMGALIAYIKSLSN
jgi:cytochrome c oxidase subunit 2